MGWATVAGQEACIGSSRTCSRTWLVDAASRRAACGDAAPREWIAGRRAIGPCSWSHGYVMLREADRRELCKAWAWARDGALGRGKPHCRRVAGRQWGASPASPAGSSLLLGWRGGSPGPARRLRGRSTATCARVGTFPGAGCRLPRWRRCGGASWARPLADECLEACQHAGHEGLQRAGRASAPHN